MRSVLNRHADIHIAGETHYFDDLRVRFSDPVGGELSEDDARRCEDYFTALTHRPYNHGGNPESGWLHRSVLRGRLEAGKPTPDNYFSAYCWLNAEQEKATIWGEKTPRHIFRIEEMVGRYPQAKIVALVRDPRAVVASYRDWRNQGGFDLENDPGHREALELEQTRARRSYNILIATMLWRSGVAAALGAQKALGSERVRLVRYEDLVQDSEEVLRDVSEWLGLEFEVGMLDAPVLNSSFHHFDDHGGFKKKAISHWKERLSDPEVAVIQQCAGQALTDSGYTALEVGTYRVRYMLEWLKFPFASLRALVANRERIGSIPSYVGRRLGLLFRRTH